MAKIFGVAFAKKSASRSIWRRSIGRGEIAYLVHSAFLRRSLTEVHRLLVVHFMENEVVVET
ncbi:hypothetical protein EB235_20830 [Mesorhizobium loti R88b]|uniref:Uncharacterized protein n=1 Tax=Mesorhizobium loti R88b TaxID=935548 RepID=A0A6M7WXA9_RHILI|nr:hypothetical protein EB235_20830 [Mesorhizobium loti R88b]